MILIIFSFLLCFTFGQVCPPLKLPAYGEWPLKSCPNRINERCLIGCNKTFELIGSSHRTCLPDGSWSGKDAQCIRRDIECPLLQTINGKLLENCINYAGSTCFILCSSSINTLSLREQQQKATIIQTVCQLDGRWSENGSSCIKPCPPLVSPVNGLIINEPCSSMPASICQFKCLDNYNLIGSSTIYCNSTGQWSSDVPECKLKPAIPRQLTLCPDIISSFSNGNYQGNCIQATAGSQCLFSCFSGYQLIGKSKLFCTNIGEWDSLPPICNQISTACPPLPLLANGSFKCNSGTGNIGSSCNFYCNQGYKLIGSPTITCMSDAKWSNSIPICEYAACPPVTTTSGTLIGECNQATYGSNCTIQCDQCSRPSFFPTIKCLDNNSWSGPLPECNRITCPNLPQPTVGILTGSCSPGICNQNCTLNCGENYLPSVYQIRCTIDGWQPNQLPQCMRASCPSLQPIENGLMEGSCSPGLSGESCSYRCKNGYALAGETRFSCTATGQWSSNLIPSCNPIQCPPPTPPAGLKLAGECQLIVDSICTFFCENKLIMTGNATIKCQENGRWSNKMPICTKEPPKQCPPIQSPVNGQTTGNCQPGIAGEKCGFLCAYGYTIVGRSELTCGASGMWDGLPPQCGLLTCSAITFSDNGFTRGDCNPGSPGKSCSFICDKGFRLIGPDIIECQGDGLWSDYPPRCVPLICPRLLPPPPNGGLLGTCDPGISGQSCSFTCPIGYRLIGPTNSLCLSDGSWSAQPPYCQLATCPSLAVPICGIATGTCSPGVLGENCTFSCSDNCSLNGTDTLTCLTNGRWSDLPPKCLDNTDQGGSDAGGDGGGGADGVGGDGSDAGSSTEPDYVTDVSTDESSDVPTEEYDTYAPTSDYPVDDTTTDSVDQTTSDPSQGPGLPPSYPTPSIPGRLCNSLAPPSGGVLIGKCTPGIPNFRCLLICSRGYKLIGSSTVTCTAKGLWSGYLGFCQRQSENYRCSSSLGCCQSLRPPSGVRMVKCSNQVGSRCKLVCPVGYKANIDVPIICQRNGQWNYPASQMQCIPRRQNMVILQWTLG